MEPATESTGEREGCSRGTRGSPPGQQRRWQHSCLKRNSRKAGEGMRGTSVTEFVVEDAALAWLEGVGFAVLHLAAPPAYAGHADRQSNTARQAGGPDIAARGRDRGGQAVAG